MSASNDPTPNEETPNEETPEQWLARVTSETCPNS